MTPPRPKSTEDLGTRDRLLDAGSELFSRKGFNGCGLNEILQRAGVPKGSFYHHFASKEEFGVALVDRTFAAFREELEQLVHDAARSPLERLRGVFEHVHQQCRRTGPTGECLIPKLALETTNLSEPMHQAVQRAYRGWGDLLAGVIREGQAVGEIRADHDAARIADTLIMLWEGATMRMQIEHSVDPLDAFLTFAFEALLRPAN